MIGRWVTTVAALGACAAPAVAQAAASAATPASARAEVAHYRAAWAAHSADAQGAPDCLGPAGDPAPGTQEWTERDFANQYCATQRLQDQYSSPAFTAAQAYEFQESGAPPGDPFRLAFPSCDGYTQLPLAEPCWQG